MTSGWRTSLMIGLTAALLPGSAGSAPAAGGDPALQIKAAFVLNFLKFVEWPAGFIEKEGGDLVVAVVGEDPMVPAIQSTLGGKVVQGRTVRVLAYPSSATGESEGQPWHAVFLAPTAARAWPRLRAAVSGKSVVTIASQSGFCAGGGMLNLVEQEGRMRFEANPDAARKVGLRLRAELLRLAKIVEADTGVRP